VIDGLRSSSSPLGPAFAKASAGKASSEGVNFSVFSKHATGVELLLFDHVDEAQAVHSVRLDSSVDRTYHYWHTFVPDVKPGQIYGYRVEGPFDPPSEEQLDYIFVTKDVEVLSAQILQVTTSDHRPLVARVRFR